MPQVYALEQKALQQSLQLGSYGLAKIILDNVLGGGDVNVIDDLHSLN